MKKGTWLKAVNLILLASFLLQACTSVILLLSAGSEIIEKIHKYNGAFFILMIFTHIAFNWGWVKANFFKREKKV